MASQYVQPFSCTVHRRDGETDRQTDHVTLTTSRSTGVDLRLKINVSELLHAFTEHLVVFEQISVTFQPREIIFLKIRWRYRIRKNSRILGILLNLVDVDSRSRIAESRL